MISALANRATTPLSLRNQLVVSCSHDRAQPDRAIAAEAAERLIATLGYEGEQRIISVVLTGGTDQTRQNIVTTAFARREEQRDLIICPSTVASWMPFATVHQIVGRFLALPISAVLRTLGLRILEAIERPKRAESFDHLHRVLTDFLDQAVDETKVSVFIDGLDRADHNSQSFLIDFALQIAIAKFRKLNSGTPAPLWIMGAACRSCLDPCALLSTEIEIVNPQQDQPGQQNSLASLELCAQLIRYFSLSPAPIEMTELCTVLDSDSATLQPFVDSGVLIAWPMAHAVEFCLRGDLFERFETSDTDVSTFATLQPSSSESSSIFRMLAECLASSSDRIKSDLVHFWMTTIEQLARLHALQIEQTFATFLQQACPAEVPLHWLLMARLYELTKKQGQLEQATEYAAALHARAPSITSQVRLAEMALLRDDLLSAAQEIEHGRGLAQRDSDPYGMVMFEALQAELFFLRGETERVASQALLCSALGQSLTIRQREQTDLVLQTTLAKTEIAAGNLAAATQFYEQNLEISRRISAPAHQVKALLGLGLTALKQGHFGQARGYYSDALCLIRRLGDMRILGFCLQNLGVLAHRQGLYAEAIGLLQEAVKAFKVTKQRQRLAWVALDLASIFIDLRVSNQAQALIDLAERLQTKHRLFAIEANLRRTQAALQRLDHNYDESRRLLAAALEKTGERNDRARQDAILLDLAEVEIESGYAERAEAIISRVSTVSDEISLRRDFIRAWSAVAQKKQTHAAPLIESLLRDLGPMHKREILWRAHYLAASNALSPIESSLRAKKALHIRQEIREDIPGLHRGSYEGHPWAIELLSLAQADFAGASTINRIVGQHPALVELLRIADKIAAHDTTVLVLGESGTGKELIAEHIHALSPRSAGPFVAVNCGAMTETLILSELFGHEKGAFTGAISRKRGVFEIADGGTLFLDEIGDLPARAQVSLLRVLQEGKFERVGGTQPVSINIRILAATHRNLENLVTSGQFRQDLFYRLSGAMIALPALRDRASDIALLVHHFIHEFSVHQPTKRRFMTEAALDLLTRYHWPGNVRELRNVVRLGCVMSEVAAIDRFTLETHYAPFRNELPVVSSPQTSSAVVHGDAPLPRELHEQFSTQGMTLRQVQRSVEISFIKAALRESQGNVTRAAEQLGLKRPRLSQLIKKHRLTRRS